jgi:uncharacterized protein (DUF433 family)
MSDEQLLEKISCDPVILCGKPVIAGTRLSVEFILGQMAHGATIADLIEEYPRLAQEDIQACLLFAQSSRN